MAEETAAAAAPAAPKVFYFFPIPIWILPLFLMSKIIIAKAYELHFI